jgi:hypothetical protein
MRPHRRARLCGCIALLLALPLRTEGVEPVEEVERAERADAAEQEKVPRDLGLREETGQRLAQLDVSLTGPPAALAELTAEDFELVVEGQPIGKLFLDRLCPDPGQAPSAPEPPRDDAPLAPPEAAPIAAARAPATLLFYFDQPFLTLPGRNLALDLAEKLIPELVRDGNRALVVSSGQELRTFADLTDDVEALLDGVARIRKDPKQWDPTSVSEETNIAEVQQALADNDVSHAVAIAKMHQADERWRAEKAMRRFSMVLARLALQDPPKAVVYFADRLRSRPGEHYLSFFGSLKRENSMQLRKMESDAFMAMNTFDRVVNEANSHGARVYTIQAEGLAGETMLVRPGRASGGTTGSPTRHLSDAAASLAGLANETGGESFRGGTRPASIVDRIREDLSCLYLLSFDPSGLPEDRPLRVLLRVREPKVKATTRGQIYLQSAQARLTSQLLGAFAAPGALRSPGDVRGSVIPTGFRDGAFTALVQLRVDGSPLSGARWDLGASQVSRDKVREDVSGRVEVSGPGIPVVLEAEMSFAPGPYELVLVAHETRSDEIVTGQLDGTWPDPAEAPVTVVDPIAVVQPEGAVFLRAGKAKRSGALGFGQSEPVRTDRPTVMIGLICHARSKPETVQLERRLVGDSWAEFPPLDVELRDERCVQFRDVIRAGTMTEGSFRYEVRVLRGSLEIATAARDFRAVAGEAGSAAVSSVTPAGS